VTILNNYSQGLIKIKLPSSQVLVNDITLIVGLSIDKAFKKKAFL